MTGDQACRNLEPLEPAVPATFGFWQPLLAQQPVLVQQPVKASHSHMQDAASHSQSLAKVTATFFYSVLHLSSFGFLNVFLDLL